MKKHNHDCLLPGHIGQSWAVWKSLYSLHTGIGRSKGNLRKWSSPIENTLCKCGENSPSHICYGAFNVLQLVWRKISCWPEKMLLTWPDTGQMLFSFNPIFFYIFKYVLHFYDLFSTYFTCSVLNIMSIICKYCDTNKDNVYNNDIIIMFP